MRLALSLSFTHITASQNRDQMNRHHKVPVTQRFCLGSRWLYFLVEEPLDENWVEVLCNLYMALEEWSYCLVCRDTR